jgi:3-hydroxybutyryl-CoA dehydrogenase
MSDAHGDAAAEPARRVVVVGAGGMSAAIARATGGRVLSGSAAELAGADLVIATDAEGLAPQQALLSSLAAAAPAAVLAVHAPAASVTALAAGTPDPGRVVGLRCHAGSDGTIVVAELVAGLDSAPGALALAHATAAELGVRVLRVADGPGLVVDRCARPFVAEALRLVEERVASPETIDRVVRAAGFPEGPFEQQDRLGLDVVAAAAERAYAESRGEPRWRPSPLSAQLVAAGRLGAASGRGWHAWAEGRVLRADDPPPVRPGGGARRPVLVRGDLMVAHELRLLAEDADWRVEEEPGGDVPWLIVEAGDGDQAAPAQGAHQVLLCARASLHQLDPGGTSVGFHALPSLEAGGLVELTRQTRTPVAAAERAEAFFASLGLHTAWVGDAPGLVLGRIVAQLVNEAAWALTAGITDDRLALDEALELACAFPRGPLGWGDEIGLEHVLAVLDGLREELGEERHRAAPLLRRMVADGHLGMAAGAGFFAYEDPAE